VYRPVSTAAGGAAEGEGEEDSIRGYGERRSRVGKATLLAGGLAGLGSGWETRRGKEQQTRPSPAPPPCLASKNPHTRHPRG
jgi:hypothetical protein